MSSTGAVSHLPIAAGEGAADKPRGANRAGADEREGGGFLKLVSKLAQAQSGAGRGDAPPTGGPGDGTRPSWGSWLSRGADGPGDQVLAGDPDLAAGEQVLNPPQSDNVALLLALAGVNDVAALVQLLGSGSFAQTIDPATVAARIANGTATDADAALVRAALAAAGNGEAASMPDATMLANLAKATSQAEARRAGHPPLPETIGKVSVLGRETHLAPVLVAAAEGNHAFGARAQPVPDTTDGALAGITGDPNLDAELVDPQSAVTAARDARWGSHPRPDSSPLSLQQPAPDATAIDEGLTGGAFQTASVVRADGLVNSGAAGGVVQQIADGVVAEASTFLGQAGRPEARGPGLAQPLGSPVKVIHIQLQPDGLGAVSIRMAVKDQALHLALEVGRGDTASLIQRDRDTLAALLRSAGYVIDGVDVRMAGSNGVAAPAMDGQAGLQMQGGGQSRGSQPEGRPQGAGPHDDPKGSSFGNGRNGEDEQAGHNLGRGGGLYV